MHFIRMLSLRKASSALILKKSIEYKYIPINGINLLTKPQFRQFHKVNPAKNAIRESVNWSGELFMKFVRRFIFNKRKHQLMALGHYVYEDIVENVNYSAFYKDFNMADTLYSWFLVTELHVWMLMARYMAEGEDGKLVRYHLVEAMWIDVDMRASKLGPIHGRIKRKQLTNLSYQFNAALFGYDEGIMSEDKILAGALWRSFFSSECNNPEYIEKLVAYVRKQICILDKIPPDEILVRRNMNWIDLRSLR